MSVTTADALHFAYTPGIELALHGEHGALWRYRFDTAHEKPFIHPLRTPGGVTLTCFEPWDHQWHRGLWFSWQYVNEVNYWEERGGVPAGVAAGRLRFEGPESVSMSPEGARIATRYAYEPPEGGVVMEERRELAFAMPAAGRYTVDWVQTTTARVPVLIRRTPEDWGGYTGLGIRTARGLGGLRRVNSEGRTDDATQHARARWCDLSGKADGGWDRSGGAAILVHPDTPRAPARWKSFGMDGFGYINPSPVIDEPLCLEAGESVTLRYRVLVHDGSLEPAGIERVYADYLAGE